jgi:transcriptional regulator with XRE-family HTH domain
VGAPRVDGGVDGRQPGVRRHDRHVRPAVQARNAVAPNAARPWAGLRQGGLGVATAWVNGPLAGGGGDAGDVGAVSRADRSSVFVVFLFVVVGSGGNGRAVDTYSLPAVLGANCREIRTEHGVTQAQLASHARRLGLRWTATKVGDFESGRSATAFGTVLTLLLALDNSISAAPGPASVLHGDGTVTRRKRPRVTLADLVAHDGFVALTHDFAPVGIRGRGGVRGQDVGVAQR